MPYGSRSSADSILIRSEEGWHHPAKWQTVNHTLSIQSADLVPLIVTTKKTLH